jgi:hypothetical protein
MKKFAELNVDLNAPQQRNWTVKWLMVDNFLSFGENTMLPANAVPRTGYAFGAGEGEGA